MGKPSSSRLLAHASAASPAELEAVLKAKRQKFENILKNRETLQKQLFVYCKKLPSRDLEANLSSCDQAHGLGSTRAMARHGHGGGGVLPKPLGRRSRLNHDLKVKRFTMPRHLLLSGVGWCCNPNYRLCRDVVCALPCILVTGEVALAAALIRRLILRYVERKLAARMAPQSAFQSNWPLAASLVISTSDKIWRKGDLDLLLGVVVEVNVGHWSRMR